MQRNREAPQYRQRSSQIVDLPPGYLQSGYFDSSGNILREVVVDWAQALALTLARQGMKMAQLYKFFREVRRLEGRLKAGVTFGSLRPEIFKLDGYARNSVKKRNAPELFWQFVHRNLQWATKDEKHFDAFVDHFESLVAYYPETR